MHICLPWCLWYVFLVGVGSDKSCGSAVGWAASGVVVATVAAVGVAVFSFRVEDASSWAASELGAADSCSGSTSMGVPAG